MTASSGGVCTVWADPALVTARLTGVTVAPDTVTAATWMASEILFALSGRRWTGQGCTATVRPVGACRHARLPGLTGLDPALALNGAAGWVGDGALDGLAGRGYGDGLSRCPNPPTVRLGASPITTVTQVLIDGAVVDPATYRIDERRRSLIRLAGADGVNLGWPVCQRWDLPTSEPGTFEVTFTFGIAPPQGGELACISLAAELAKAMTPGADGCRLPGRVSSVQSQGVAIVVDPQTVVKDGLTGLPEVDSWVVAVNPGRLARRSGVLSPDSLPVRVPQVTIPDSYQAPDDDRVIDGGVFGTAAPR